MSGSAGIHAAMLQGPHHSYFFEITIAMEKLSLVLQCYLRNATVERAAQGDPRAAELEEDASPANPSLSCHFDVWLFG